MLEYQTVKSKFSYSQFAFEIRICHMWHYKMPVGNPSGAIHRDKNNTRLSDNFLTWHIYPEVLSNG